MALLRRCVVEVARNLPAYAGQLRALPLELAVMVLQEIVEHRPSHRRIVAELQLFCQVFWSPKSISLANVARVNGAGLFCLHMAGRALESLDLSDCVWLDSLYFLPGLSQLRCLDLRGCRLLPGDCLVSIKALPQLECLNLEDVASIKDSAAAYHIATMRRLRALNVSGTGAGDQLIDALTYGARLRNWAGDKGVVAVREGGDVEGDDDASSSSTGLDYVQSLLLSWPTSQLVHLRMQGTTITKESVVKLLALPNLLLIDVRNTSIASRSLASLAAKYGLTALAENPKLVARSNSVMAATLRGACGCRAMDSIPSKPCRSDQGKGEHFVEWERAGVVMLLQEASCVIGGPSSARDFWRPFQSLHPGNTSRVVGYGG